MFDNGYKEHIIDFEFWTLLTSGVGEHVKYKRISSKHMYPKLLTCFTENAHSDEVHCPVIGKTSSMEWRLGYFTTSILSSIKRSSSSAQERT